MNLEAIKLLTTSLLSSMISPVEHEQDRSSTSGDDDGEHSVSPPPVVIARVDLQGGDDPGRDGEVDDVRHGRETLHESTPFQGREVTEEDGEDYTHRNEPYQYDVIVYITFEEVLNSPTSTPVPPIVERTEPAATV